MKREQLITANRQMQEIPTSYHPWEHELRVMHDRCIEQDKRILRMQNKIDSLAHRNQELEKNVQEYGQIHREWEQERNNLYSKQEAMEKRIASYERSKSYRLGYALVFGFKSWKGFKYLLKILITLPFEKKKSKVLATPVISTLRKPEFSLKTWKGRKVVLQWPSELMKWKEYSETIYLGSQDSIKLPDDGIVQRIACSGAVQMLLDVNAYTNESNPAIKQVVATIAFYGKEQQVLAAVVDLPKSAKLNKYYFYLDVDKNKSDTLLVLPPAGCEYVEIGIVPWDVQSEIYVRREIGVQRYNSGVSVIIPTYKGAKHIRKCLDSLIAQTLDGSLFEVLVVMNGPKDGTEKILKKYQELYPAFNLRYFSLDIANVSKARNFGIKQAKFAWTTFIDDDDFVDVKFLSAMYAEAMYHTITLTGIDDFVDGKSVGSPILKQLEKAFLKEEIQYNDVTSTLTMNACKLVPTYMVQAVNYCSDLRSGEDVVLWCDVLMRFMPKVAIVSDFQMASYKRVITDNSVSRQKESYDFNVQQRLEVIKHLDAMQESSDNQYLIDFVQSKIRAQASFVKRYLEKYPQDYQRTLENVRDMGLNNNFLSEINGVFSDTLVISYCYAPFIDTSGVVMSKRVRAMSKPVDIIFNDMSKVRPSDHRLMSISNNYLGRKIKLNAPQAFSNWQAIEKFADLSLIELAQVFRTRPVYNELYSRAMWPASHFAAAVVKMKYPQMRWIAEFSDPLLMDVSGNQRYVEMPIEWLKQHGFIKSMEDNYISDNLFYWCEMLPYLYADELIFTNRNQLDYMLSYADENIKECISHKAIILPQPTLDREFYELSDINLTRDQGLFYLGYFGSFYVNRGFAPFISAWDKLDEKIKSTIRLCVYTQQDSTSILEAIPESLRQFIQIQEYVGYFDFLKLTDQFDALLVMDTQTKGVKMNNPYLPSKLSDYLGSHAKILALVEDGSPTSMIIHERLFKADLNSTQDIKSVLLQLL